jgi:hypothetical protein
MDGWSFLEAKQRCGKANLKELLNEGRLAAACRVGGDEGDLVPIPKSTWSKLHVDEETPELLQHENGAVFHGLRLFPVLHAPNAADLLHDQSLADVFMAYVVRDPEVSVLGSVVMAQKNVSGQIFTDGMAPGWYVNYHWTLNKSGQELASDFVGLPFADNRPPSAAIKLVAQVLALRIAALRTLLISGRLIAWGTHWNTGTPGPIRRMLWVRANQAIEVRNGDLCEYQNSKYIPTWTGIVLQRASDDIRASATFDEIVQRRDRKNSSGTTIRSENQCKSWLAQLMHDHPQGRLRPKLALFKEAEQKWLISRRAFERAWSAAIAESDAAAWRSGGRPRKTSAPETSTPK